MNSVQENCGVFGLYSKRECVYDIYRGIDFLQHRGQEYCGISTFDSNIGQATQIDFLKLREQEYDDDASFGQEVDHVTHHGKVIETFTDEELNSLKGNWGIGHVSLLERQPMKWQTRLGEIAIAFSGKVVNVDELVKGMMDQGMSFYKGYDVEIISKVIIGKPDMVSGISALAGKIKGSYSLVVLTRDGIYAARDIYGFRPLILGMDSERYVVSSESRAIQNLGMENFRDVRPGEIVLINDKGFQTVGQVDSPRSAHCAFEWAYTASIDSIIDGVYVQEARNNLGANLAQRDIDEGDLVADIVSPVPLSGIGHALGYHKRSKINYQEVFLYHRYADRSYMQATQLAREKMAKRKLSVLPYAVKGKKIVLCDDSIVRGTQILYKVRDLKKAGAKEVHVRIACPPLMYPCEYGISTRSYDELVARRYMKTGDITSVDDLKKMEAWIAKQIDADSVKFNTIDAFVSALSIPKNGLCLRCFDGISPIENL
ncbi:MAG: amidophosphoribosyltransferase [Thermodesulfobacteriota bacterium]|nr:amidophosphoribosyltransferase [Thermodesulfobacteriota bacterium]